MSAGQSSSEDVGEFLIVMTPRPGHSLTELEVAADAVIERMKAEGPTTEEIQKAVAGEELSFVRGLESNLNKAMTLADGAGLHGDPGQFKVVSEDARGHCRGRQAGRQHLSHSRTRRAEHRPDRQARSSGEAWREPQGHTQHHASSGGRAMMSAGSRWLRRATGLAVGAALLSLPVVAQQTLVQQTLDQAVIPPPGKPPVLRVPTGPAPRSPTAQN